jgi:hypothetical protein
MAQELAHDRQAQAQRRAHARVNVEDVIYMRAGIGLKFDVDEGTSMDCVASAWKEGKQCDACIEFRCC